jgi:hypothetical protein
MIKPENHARLTHCFSPIPGVYQQPDRTIAADGLLLQPAQRDGQFCAGRASAEEPRLARERTPARLLGEGTSELRYRDLDWAIEHLNQLAMKGN